MREARSLLFVVVYLVQGNDKEILVSVLWSCFGILLPLQIYNSEDNDILEVKSKKCFYVRILFFFNYPWISGIAAANKSIGFIFGHWWHYYSLYLWPYWWFSFTPFYFSCMKSLKYPLLTAQLEQLEGIEEHPFRHFATEIVVSAVKVNTSVFKPSGLVQNYLEFVLELILLPLLVSGMTSAVCGIG